MNSAEVPDRKTTSQVEKWFCFSMQATLAQESGFVQEEEKYSN